MQPYQDEYIANLKEISTLTARQKPRGLSFEEYLKELLENRERAQQLSKRNMELLRNNLFPVLDHLFAAGDKVCSELQEFAGRTAERAQRAGCEGCFVRSIRLCSAMPG